MDSVLGEWRERSSRRPVGSRRACGAVSALAYVALLILADSAGAQQVASVPKLATGPFQMALFPTNAAPDARGFAHLVYAQSPFGISVTPDGRARYDVQIDASGLPRPDSLGTFRVYVAWTASTDLAAWRRLGTVKNGSSTVGTADLNKFLFVVTAESDSTVETRHGPTVLHGSSPSTWLQSFLTHPLFRGVSP